MKLITFQAYRTLGLPDVRYIKPSLMFKEIDAIREADVVLFPETWQVPALVYGLKKHIFPSIETLQLGFSKVDMTRALWTVAPENVPYTEIMANTAANIDYVLNAFPYPFVAKEARNARGNGVFLIEREADFRRYAEQSEVLYVQEYLENDGKELRVCVVGDQVFTAYWKVCPEGSFLHNVAQGGDICFDFVPREACELVLRVARELNINHAGFDVMISGDRFYILEFNALFGNQGIQARGLSVETAIYQYLIQQFVPTFPTSPTTPGKIIS
ncbi:hypothetical protein DUZ99_14145 [Xylanibacillus composti]|nr:hypothetical protein [Xylanibacillus composti]MDT9726120.1 hypothetical protein [Xylanibacillus composti]